MDPVRMIAQVDLLLLAARWLAPPAGERDVIERSDLEELACRAGFAGGGVLWAAESALRRTATDRWSDEHARLFESAGVCPPNETAYIRRDKGVILADICGFYSAFGFRLADGGHEKADHLRTELEFTAFLLLMLARARAEGREEEAIITRDAVASFLADHLGTWLPLFAERLAGTTTLPFLRHLATVLGAAVDLVVTANDLPRPGETTVAPPEGDPGTPYECGLERFPS